ncbi:MAG: hypothetical protein KA956_04485 [Pyrinomonadaceae bacterium]|nr:hypothetical protein [Acidobacteriota bacterium]MBK7933774.1 hypothetical protein [Acidobacteriota bacterium]MBP7375710.1 hypothetical protein [Pyrinomonadaceae bacterium]
MKKTKLLSIIAVILVSIFFNQSTNAESVEAFGSNFASCRVSKSNAKFFVSATEKTIRLKKGTALSWTIPEMHQGLIVVKAKVGTKWIKGEILMDDTTCR